MEYWNVIRDTVLEYNNIVEVYSRMEYWNVIKDTVLEYNDTSMTRTKCTHTLE